MKTIKIFQSFCPPGEDHFTRDELEKLKKTFKMLLRLGAGWNREVRRKKVERMHVEIHDKAGYRGEPAAFRLACARRTLRKINFFQHIRGTNAKRQSRETDKRKHVSEQVVDAHEITRALKP